MSSRAMLERGRDRRAHSEAARGSEVVAPTLWSARLIAVREETPTVRTFLFERPRVPFGFRPGQYLAVRLPGLSDPRGDSRTFSISSAPSDQEGVSVTTREGPSPFKRRLFSSAPGDELELWGPFGNFVLDATRPSVLVGGGIGITPFRSMIREEAHAGSRLPLGLLYSGRTPEELVYRHEFEELARNWPSFGLMLSVSRGGDAKGSWTGPVGRIEGTSVRRYSRKLDRPLYYVCGPPRMVEDLSRMIVREGNVPPEDLRTELFRGY